MRVSLGERYIRVKDHKDEFEGEIHQSRTMRVSLRERYLRVKDHAGEFEGEIPQRQGP